MNRTILMLALSAFAVVAPFPVSADNAEPKKIKLETLKKGPVQIDPAYGYVIVRMGPMGNKEKPSAIAFRRVSSADGSALKTPDTPNPKDFFRSLTVVVDPARPFDVVNGVGVFVVKVYPGRWVLNNVEATCLSLGTYTFDIKAGQVVDFGTVLTARENGKSTLPEFKAVALSDDLIKSGTLTVMTDTIFVKPAVAAAPLPSELAGFTVTPATLGEDYRFDNFCRTLTNRAASLPRLEHQKPLSQEDARAVIAKMNGK